jgi:hypothetical protein
MPYLPTFLPLPTFRLRALFVAVAIAAVVCWYVTAHLHIHIYPSYDRVVKPATFEKPTEYVVRGVYVFEVYWW